MAEPKIAINGRELNEAQAMAVRAAITHFRAHASEPHAPGADEHGKRMAEAYRDRLSEVLGMVFAPAPSQAKVMLQATRDRANRILQLAGIVPEKASQADRDLAERYALAGMPIDEAATRLKRTIWHPMFRVSAAPIELETSLIAPGA